MRVQAGYNPSGTITNNYGIYVLGQTAGTTNYAIYTNAGTVHFGDNVGFGVTSPQGRLHGYDGTGGFIRWSHASVVSIIVATAIVFAIEWLRVCIDIMDTDKQIKAEIAEIETKITELKVPDGIGEDSEVTLDGGMVYFINVPENEKYKIVISDVKHGS